jgi:hypothetical protein
VLNLLDIEEMENTTVEPANYSVLPIAPNRRWIYPLPKDIV